MDWELLKREYRSSLAARLQELTLLEAGLQQGEAEALEAARRIGHKLHGSGASYGFPPVSALGRELELASDADALTAFLGLKALLTELTG